MEEVSYIRIIFGEVGVVNVVCESTVTYVIC